MTNFIPIFPLAIVVYPDEAINLHIFEPRYKQLIQECHQNRKSFGIPAVINNKVRELGTLMEVREIVTAYDNGEMDIRVRGDRIFRVLEFIETVPDKLYGGAIVNYPDNDDQGNRKLMQKVVDSIRELHRLLSISKDFQKPDEELLSYDVAHHVGLSIEEEYEFLGLMMELQRQEYLRRHLQKVLPVVAEMEGLKEKIKLNGHFRNLSPFDFDFEK